MKSKNSHKYKSHTAITSIVCYFSNVDFVLATQEANSKIVDEFLGFCEASDNDRTLSPSRKRAEAIPKKSPQDEFAQNLA